MKLKKLLASILAAAMVLGTMGITTFAEGEVETIRVSTADNLATALTENKENIAVTLEGDIDLPITSLGSITAGSGEYKLGGENTQKITIDLNKKTLNVTTTYWSALGSVNPDATITVKNGTMVSTGNSATTWNANDLRFCNCNWVFEDVTFNKEVALDNAGKSTTMNDVTINGTGDYYALWITAEGQTVNIDDLVIDTKGRGIKIDEQYVDAEKVSLAVSNSTFKTAKKAAIVVKSVAGADISTENVDISEVAADSNNLVWIDEIASYDKVDLTGGSIGIESNLNAVALIGTTTYTDLATAMEAAKSGGTLVLLDDVTVAATNGGYNKAGIVQNGFDIDGNGHTLNVTGANTTWDCAIYTNGGTIKNLTIASGMRGVFTAGQTEDIILENVTIDGPIYTISADGASGVRWIIKNSTLNGWTSYARGFEVVSFENCTFGEGSGYAYMRPYADTIYTGCDFASDYTVDVRAKVEVEDCTIDGTPMTAEDVAELLGGSAQANIGSVYYDSINDAFAAAVDGDTITIFAGEYEGFDVPANKNNLTFVGETDADGNNLVTIKTLEDGITSHNGGIFVGSETTTFKNLNFTAGTVEGVKSGWMSSSLGNTNGDTGMSSSLKNLTVENCNFTGSGAYQAIWTNQGNVTVRNSTITNYDTAVDTYGIHADQEMVIENTEIADVRNAFHTGEAVNGSQIVVTKTTIDSDVIDIGGAVAVTVEESTIKNAAVTTYASSTFAVSESALYDTIYAVDENATGSITLYAVYANNVNELATNAKADNIAFNTYYPEAKDLGTGNTVAVPAATDAIYVKFENVTDADAEGEMTYNINLVATKTEIINRLNSADLTFAFDATEGDVAYEIIASNSEVAVNPVDNSKVRYEFHYNGKDGVTTDSANKITIGQVRFEGYGKFDFTVDATVDTNTAHATTVADNIVDTFIPNVDATTVANGKLVIDDTTITDVEIAVPVRTLTINLDFPNAVEDNKIAYQDMKVEITGTIEGVQQTVTYNLGEDEVAMTNGDYVVVEDALVLNNAYTVTVSGAGYRTARYTVTMTDDKQLNFWNNVMDEAQVVELGKDSSVAKVTFLAGDIVKDNNINIYDLSAVVSYFGTTTDVSAYSDYAKYDLNRDGKVDSKDVAYVLVSWGK